MVSQMVLRSCCISCTLLLVQAIVLSTAAVPARGARHLLWLQQRAGRDSDFAASERWRRDLGGLEDDHGGCDSDNCSRVCDPPSADDYNDTCQFVKEECGDKFELFNYLRLAYCNTGKYAGFIILALWLCYVLLLLSTTVDKFFVPVLQLLSKKLRLPASIAGMTLLALGNGAPDIFVAFSALQDDDLPLMLGALMGAGLFITTVVLSTVLLVTPSKTYNINPLDFMRDLVAYIVVLVLIVGVAYDGKVTLAEAISFPLLYIIYVALVVSLSYFTKWLAKRKAAKTVKQSIFFDKDKEEITVEEDTDSSPEMAPRVKRSITKESVITDDEKVKSVILPPIATAPKKVELVGLTIPKGKFQKVLYILEFPFSVLRWLTIPPCCHDGQWSIFHFLFAVFSPIPMSLFLLLVATGGWSGFTRTINNSGFPVAVVVVLCVSPLCLLLFATLSYKKPPHWVMQIVLMIGAFVMSIAWLNIIANEVVDVLQALGLIAGVSTAILGLTVLAIGNSVADWVSDTLVARKGQPEMALASCFGAPLITHVLGLTVALLPKIFENDGRAYEFAIGDIGFVHVKLAWIFLGIVLLGSAVIFPLFRFKPPIEYGLVLVYVYTIFMIFSVLVEAGKLNITLT